MRKRKVLPNFDFEGRCGKDLCVIGVDEVGRGALAGPVVAGAVYLPGPVGFWMKLGIDDSKRLVPAKREVLAKIILDRAFWGVGESSVNTINSLGIVKAVESAMRSAITQVREKSPHRQTFILVDAFQIKYVPGVGFKNQLPIIKGDQKSISIAAASIIAKVYRDKLMSELGTKYNVYELAKNKGYGTRKHIGAIKNFGVCKLHRVRFVDSLETC